MFTLSKHKLIFTALIMIAMCIVTFYDSTSSSEQRRLSQLQRDKDAIGRNLNVSNEWKIKKLKEVEAQIAAQTGLADAEKEENLKKGKGNDFMKIAILTGLAILMLYILFAEVAVVAMVFTVIIMALGFYSFAKYVLGIDVLDGNIQERIAYLSVLIFTVLGAGIGSVWLFGIVLQDIKTKEAMLHSPVYLDGTARGKVFELVARAKKEALELAARTNELGIQKYKNIGELDWTAESDWHQSYNFKPVRNVTPSNNERVPNYAKSKTKTANTQGEAV